MNKLSKLCVTSAIVALTSINSAQAGWLKEFEKAVVGVHEGVIEIHQTALDPITQDLRADFVICNESNLNMSYSVGAQSAMLNPGNCVSWTTAGQAMISFDSSILDGYQARQLWVNDGRYVFKMTAGGWVDLYRS